MSDLLRIRNLEKHYEGFDLQNVNIDVPAGSVVGFVGSNGAGKTTTIKATLGLVRPDGGSIAIFGEEVTGAPSKRLAELKQRIGVVFDTCSFPDELSVETVGKLMAQCYRSWNATAFHTFAKAFELPLDKTVKDLSRGMGMKLSLICALSHNPDLLVLDEATAGRDHRLLRRRAMPGRGIRRHCGQRLLRTGHAPFRAQRLWHGRARARPPGVRRALPPDRA